MSRLAKKLMIAIAAIFCFQNMTVQAAVNPTNLEWEKRIISEEEIVQFEIVKILNLEELKQEPVVLLPGKLTPPHGNSWTLKESSTSRNIEQ